MSGWPALVIWAAVGAAAGVAVRWGSVRLARMEGLEPGARVWQVYGPPVATLALFGLFGYELGLTPLLLIRSLWVAVFIQIVFFDFEHHLILNRIVLPAMLAAIVLSFATPGLGWKSSVVAGVAAGGFFLLMAVLGSVAFRTEAMGMGDVKLAALIGLILGLGAGLATFRALILGVVLAGVVAVVLLVARIKSMKEAFAYGPFLSAGALIVLFQLGRAG